LSPKNGPLGQRPGPGEDGQNNIKTPYLWRSPQKTSNPKNIFLCQPEDLLNPWRVWTVL